MCRHCSLTKSYEGRVNTYCLSCYQQLKLVGINDTDTRDRNTLIKDIQAKVYGLVIHFNGLHHVRNSTSS